MLSLSWCPQRATLQQRLELLTDPDLEPRNQIETITGGGLPAESYRYDGYAYSRANPLNYTDPTGHFVLATMALGAAIGERLLAQPICGQRKSGILMRSAWRLALVR